MYCLANWQPDMPEQHKIFLRVFHLEDNPRDAEMIQRALEDSGIRCAIERVCTRVEFEKKLATQTADLILSDSNLPGFSTWDALAYAGKTSPETPFVFVSGNRSPEIKNSAIQNGALDYVPKDDLEKLVHRVQRIAKETIELPAAGEPVILQCDEFRCLGYLDAAGVWRDYANSRELPGVTAWESV